MTKPKDVRVGPHNISISFSANVIHDDTCVFGLYENEKGRISVSTKQTPSMQADSLLHEILHAIHYFSLGSPLSDNKIDLDEEQITTLTSTSLCQVMRDNPKVFQWLQEQLK